VGEFNTINAEPYSIESMQQILAMMNEMGIHWTPWTYKQWNQNSIWGLYHSKSGLEWIDVANLSLEEIKARFRLFETGHFETYPSYEAAHRDNFAAFEKYPAFAE